MTKGASGAERKSSRLRRPGRLHFEGQRSGVPCTVSDLTDSGAVLSSPGWLGMPDSFTLLLRHDGLCFDCQVVSRAANALRVRFEGPAEMPVTNS